MPICTTCTVTVPYLYTVYQSAHNLRLEQCPKCLNFADPYVEHDNLTLLLDLILLKRGVFRHLLFNRGYEPRRATETPASPDSQDVSIDGVKSVQSQRETARVQMIIELGLVLIFVDAIIRWSHLKSSQPSDSKASLAWETDQLQPLLRIFAGCLIETVAFHTGVTLMSALAFKVEDLWRDYIRPREGKVPLSGVRAEFKLSHIPLTLLYSSLTKLFLLLLLSLWKPSSAPSSGDVSGTHISSFASIEAARAALQVLDDDKLDREWVVRNVLGGMAAGFGLRVVLDIHPVFTTFIVLTGWAVKTFVANLVHPWYTMIMMMNSWLLGDFLFYARAQELVRIARGQKMDHSTRFVKRGSILEKKTECEQNLNFAFLNSSQDWLKMARLLKINDYRMVT